MILFIIIITQLCVIQLLSNYAVILYIFQNRISLDIITLQYLYELIILICT